LSDAKCVAEYHSAALGFLLSRAICAAPRRRKHEKFAENARNSPKTREIRPLRHTRFALPPKAAPT